MLAALKGVHKTGRKYTSFNLVMDKLRENNPNGFSENEVLNLLDDCQEYCEKCIDKGTGGTEQVKFLKLVCTEEVLAEVCAGT